MKTTTIAQEIATQLIAFDTSKPEQVLPSMKWIETWCSAQGLSVKKFPKTKAMLIETHPEAKRHLSFVTHIDVVPADGWKEAFTPQIKNNFLVGRGAVDDKGPLAVCLEVLAKAKHNADMNISCLIVTDEETQNAEIQKIIKTKTFHPDFCIVADGGTHNMFDIGQKGIIRFEVFIRTSGGHSAFEEKEKSASAQLLEFISELEKHAAKLPHHPTFSKAFINVSKIHAETLPYGLPTHAEAHIEIQFPLPQKSANWVEIIQNLSEKGKNSILRIHWISEPHVLEDAKLLKMLSSLSQVRCMTTGGNNLAKDFCLAGIPAVSHCPVAQYMAHCPEEKIKLTDLHEGVQLYLKIIDLFTKN